MVALNLSASIQIGRKRARASGADVDVMAIVAVLLCSGCVLGRLASGLLCESLAGCLVASLTGLLLASLTSATVRLLASERRDPGMTGLDRLDRIHRGLLVNLWGA
jgi:hypothetical protein